ncbi:MAG TPA: glycosyltransferase family 25 protein [Anaerolineaceae bacterium]|nr:glycosyltransferase family 25 protein [Anaerolineaceae bacterium]
MKIFIIHYDKLVERKLYMEKQLIDQGISAEWYIQKESEPYSQSEIDKYYKYDVQEWKKKTAEINANLIYRRLGHHEISLLINHLKILEKIKIGYDDYALVLEDDAIFEEEFTEILKTIEELIKQIKWDICYLDWGYESAPFFNDYTIIEERLDEHSWGTGAYIVSKDVANLLVSKHKQAHLAIDEELKYRIRDLGLKAIWIAPGVIKQGSLIELYPSIIDSDREKTGIKKYLYWRKTIYRFLESNKIDWLLKPLEGFEAYLKKLLLK